MSEFWNDVIPRLIGILVALLVTWGTRRGIALNSEELTAFFVAIYAIVHRAVTAGRDTRRTARFKRALAAKSHDRIVSHDD